MQKSLISLPAAIAKDINLQLKRQIKWILLFRVAILSLLLGVSSLLHYSRPELNLPPFPYIFAFILAVYVFSIASATLINRLKNFKFFVYAQLLADSVFTTFIVYFSGGSHSIFTFIYFFPVISGGILLFKRGGMIMASFSTLNYGFLLSQEFLSLSPYLPDIIRLNQPTSPIILLQNLAVYGLSFYLVAMLSAFLAERLHLTEKALSQTSLNYDRLTLLYKQIFDDISSGIITIDDRSTVTSFNRAAEEITGYTSNEAIGRSIEYLFPEFMGAGLNSNRPVINLTKKNQEKNPCRLFLG